jgi:N6-adenosine-specific RNA methylase IME4/ParB-like chromosome segregation protein Spo0J
MKPRLTHPLADLFPPLSRDEYAALRDSIRANGQREPITLHRDGRIIDGRHREAACAELGIAVTTRTFDGSDADILQFVLDLNLKRRHLDASQRAMIAADLTNLGEGRPGKTAQICAVSQQHAAELLNVSRRSVQHAVDVRDHAIPEIAAAVRQGHMSVSKAAHVADLSEAGQQRVAAEMHNGKSLATTVLAAKRRERIAAIEVAANNCRLTALGRTFPVLYADPPWRWESWSAGGMLKAGEMHYPTMPTAEIAALSVAEIAAKDAALFMWFLPGMMPDALRVVEAWGFTYITFVIALKPRITCGHWFRSQFEPLLLATRVNMPPPPELHSSVFEWTTSGPHSMKPNSVRDWIASAYPNVGRIELFARTASPGWMAWGNQAPAP